MTSVRNPQCDNCKYCKNKYTRMCDGKLAVGGICNVKICNTHSKQPIVDLDKDLCPPHWRMWLDRQAKKNDVRCPKCNAQMILLDKLRFGKLSIFYACPNFPGCRNTHGCHRDTLKPLGVPGDETVRQARKRAHTAFDRLWECGSMTRSHAYGNLAQAMGKRSVHMASMNKEECDFVVRWANNAYDTWVNTVDETMDEFNWMEQD